MAVHFMFWAKTLSGSLFPNSSAARYKPVGHHALDAAAVVDRYLAANPARLRRESMLTGLSPEAHARLATVLAALHDLGKISPWFQALAPEFWPTDVLGIMPESARSISHWQATAVLLCHSNISLLLEQRLPVFVTDNQIVAAIAGHHGRPPASEYLDAHSGFHRAAIGDACIAAARSLCQEMLDLLVPEPITSSPGEQLEAFSFCLNGLITLADWVGSDSDVFVFEDPQMPLSDYWPLALERADRALSMKGLLPAKPITSVALSGISSRAGSTPRPMQTAALELPVSSEPQLVIIEDGTGSGKTEAAFMLAARMMAAGCGEGIYVALPTMATANAMHGRLDVAMAGLFETRADRPPSLVLAHGKARLASALDNLAHAGKAAGGQVGKREETVSERFTAWIGDSRKKAFFADAGAGTIDQAFLSILPKKHLSLRQYALAGRILVIDEAHACDAYMGEELKTLIEMHARLGGSVIILSATLGEMMRRQLILAFARGRGLKNRLAEPLKRRPLSQAYPLLTRYAETDGLREEPVEALDAQHRTINIARLDNREASIALALEAARRGASVAIICNAVDSAIALHAALVAAGYPEDCLTLFHARFAMGDRMEIEEKVLRYFGSESGVHTRSGKVLIATQVIEQSLDLDFDVMISDLAPVDLLIQRAGRLWRHNRSNRPISEPVMHIVAPEFSAAVDADWLNDTLGPAAHTYQLPGVLWRTARDLFGRGCLETPNDLRKLVEAAYLQEGDDLPEGLAQAHESAVGKHLGDRFHGQFNTIEPQSGYAGLRDVSNDEDIGTRLAEETVTLRLARAVAAGLVPFICRPGASDAVNWALSEVTVRYRWLAGKDASDHPSLPAARNAAAVDALKANWPEWEQSIPVYTVGDDGKLMTDGGDELNYCQRSGLQRAVADTLR